MNTQRVRIISNSRTNWYKDQVGDIFEVNMEIDRPDKPTYTLVRSKHNQNTLLSHDNRVERLLHASIGIRKDHCVFVEVDSNEEALFLLNTEE
jgi:hypothetical protein